MKDLWFLSDPDLVHLANALLVRKMEKEKSEQAGASAAISSLIRRDAHQ